MTKTHNHIFIGNLIIILNFNIWAFINKFIYLFITWNNKSNILIMKWGKYLK